jgi:hypothetical protein
MSRPQALLLNALTIEELGTWKLAIGQTRTPQQQAGRKRTLDDIKTYFDREDRTKRPDGTIFDFHHRTIYVIEVARTGDSPGSLRNRYLTKTLKYASIVEGLRKAFTPCKVEQITLVIGFLGSIEESRWRQSLEAFGMTRSQQDKLIRRCMVATLEGTHLAVCVFITAGPITKLFAGGGGGEWTTCAMIDDEPRPVWMSPLITH